MKREPKSYSQALGIEFQPLQRVKKQQETSHKVIPTGGFQNQGYTGKGDCEDYRLLKRRILAEQGLSRRAMRMTVVIDEEGGGHAVMMVRTDRGDLILDNRRPAILPWTQTGYVYIKAEGQDGMEWVSLGGATSPIVTAHNEGPPPSSSTARVASR